MGRDHRLQASAARCHRSARGGGSASAELPELGRCVKLAKTGEYSGTSASAGGRKGKYDSCLARAKKKIHGRHRKPVLQGPAPQHDPCSFGEG